MFTKSIVRPSRDESITCLYTAPQSIVEAVEIGRRERHVAAGRGLGGNGEHGDAGAGGDTARGRHLTGVRISRRLRRNHARDRGTVRDAVAGLVRRPGEEVFRHRPAGEQRVAGIDPGVDDADRPAATRYRIDAALQLELRPCAPRPDRAQPHWFA